MPLEVVGAGYGRTGTFTLRTILMQLGFDKCYHMADVFEDLSRSQIWQDALDGKSVDWESHFQGYKAAVDWPACAFWKELSEFYPDAKVILSSRTPESWYKSFSNTIKAFLGSDQAPSPEMKAHYKMTQELIRFGTFDDRMDDEAFMIQKFKDHEQEVRDTVPANRLLVYNVAEGWEPLCSFLGVPVPEGQVPHTNTTKDFQENAKKSFKDLE